MKNSPIDIIVTQTYHAPCGTLLLGTWKDRLCLCEWDVDTVRRSFKRLSLTLNATFRTGTSPLLEEAARQLDDYFTEHRESFNLPLLMVGSSFQKSVWQALTCIPYGSTVAYADIAEAVSHPRGVRAVATAIRDNAISIIVPCHRVVPRCGGIGNYAGGAAAKAWLIELERAHSTNQRPFFA